jgi:membrane associated rhomboid family serine protease
MNYYQPRRFSILPEVIKNLLIINGLLFLATFVLGNLGVDLYQYLALYLPGSELFRPHQLITHMFMHGTFGHIFFNMFALWMFGNTLENVWGGKRFLMYYLITGLGAAMIHLGVNYWEASSVANELMNLGYTVADLEKMREGLVPNNAISGSMPLMQRYYGMYTTPTVGASGAVYGILLAFGMMFPNMRIYLYFLFPIKAKYFVAALGLLELINGLSMDPNSNIAHFAHLGGMLFGFILIKYWQKRPPKFS